MALINCKKCGCQMSDKSEACPLCGMPVGADVDEYNKKIETKTVIQAEVPSEMNAPAPSGTVSPNSKKNKTPIWIGIIAAITMVIVVAVLLLMKGKKKKQEKQAASIEQLLSEQRAEYEQILADQQAEYEQQLEEIGNEYNAIQPPKVYSNAYDGFLNIRQAPQSKAPIVGVLNNGPEGAILLVTEGEWKKIDCNGIVGYVYEKYVQDTPTEVYQYWGVLRKDASMYHFTENDLYPLTAKELTYLRNSVYARHGYVFKSQELNNYFKQFSWYYPNSSVTDAVLNRTEKENVENIIPIRPT